MLALEYNGKVVLRNDYPTPVPPSGEAMIEVKIAGVCRTDLEIVKGYMNFKGVLGHEFVGIVKDGPAQWIGKRVVGEINCPCGQCSLCAAGLGKHCRSRTVLGIQKRDGVFAQYVSLPVANLHEVPANVSDEQAAFVEPVAAAAQIVRQIKFIPTDEVVVIGDGRLGLLAAMVIRNYVRGVQLVGKHEKKLAIARQAGIESTLVKDFQPRRSARFVVDATGTVDGFNLAMRTVIPAGTIVLKSTFAGSSGPNLAPVVIDEVTIVGSRCGPFPEAIRLLASREVDVRPLISKRFPLAQADQAMIAAASPENIKVLIDV